MMLANRYSVWCLSVVAVAASVLAAGQSSGVQNPKETERRLIDVLQSNAPLGEKAITCKRLAVYGTQEAVPALAPLLANEELASWARIALEVIPGPAADEALRGAMGKLQGRLLVGVINSIGNRRDAQAVGGLAGKLKDADAEVASAAAVALGRIGGDQAATALGQSLAAAPAPVRSAVAEGCVLCAERYSAEGKSAEAVRLYDAVRQADVPKQRILEATRGAILARGSGGMPLLVEQLRSTDRAMLGIGLRTARELPGRDVTEALAGELDRLAPDRQPLLLLALADRSDPAVLPAVLKAARSGPDAVRITAVSVLTRLGSVSTLPVLLDAAVAGDAELAQTAKMTISRLPGKDVDADILARMPQASGKMRQVLIELAGQRQVEGALPAIMLSVEDADAGIRGAAVQALGVLGNDKQAADLVKLLQKNQNSRERSDIEKALQAISGRCGASCIPHLLPLMQSSDSALRITGLHVLAIAGGPEALAAVKSAVDDRDEPVQDEAARTLSTWPNNWPGDTAAAEALLTLAKSGKKTLHQVLGLRGYLQYVQGDKKLNNQQKVAKINDLMPLISRPEEKRFAIGVVGGIPTAGALELLTTLAADTTVTEEACSAIVNLAGRNARGVSAQQRQQALQTVVEKSKNAATKKRAEDLLKGLR